MIAQTAHISPAGEYYLRGVMETASGFKLEEDSSFQFFFSYGALDRFGSGKWTTKDDKVILNSLKKHASDFELVKSQKIKSDKITIKIIDSNAMMLRHIYCMVEGGNKKQQGLVNEEGTISFTSQDVDSLELVFEFCPEKRSVISLPVKGHNYFEFRFEPWILEVLFENFPLEINERELRGLHPLMEPKSYRYEKAGH